MLPVIDADRIQRIQLNARHKESCRPIIIAEETVASPHPFLDPIIKRATFEDQLAERLCSMCPDCGDCAIAGDPGAQYRCNQLRRAMGQ